VNGRLVLGLSIALLAGGCGSAERRADPVAGTFRISSAVHGTSRVLALVPGTADVPLVRLVDAPPGSADGAPIEVSAEVAAERADGAAARTGGSDLATIADWRFASFSQGLYRIGSAGAGDRLSIAAGYGRSPSGIELASSRKSAFQLWYVVPLADGHCRLVSALFPDASFDVASGDADGNDDAGREPRLAPTSDDIVGQRWRFVPLAGTAADGLPSLCGGVARDG